MRGEEVVFRELQHFAAAEPRGPVSVPPVCSRADPLRS